MKQKTSLAKFFWKLDSKSADKCSEIFQVYLCIHLIVPWSGGLGVEGMEFGQLIQSNPSCTLPVFHLLSPPQRSNSHCLSNLTGEKVTCHPDPQLRCINKSKSGSPKWFGLVQLHAFILEKYNYESILPVSLYENWLSANSLICEGQNCHQLLLSAILFS